MKTFVKTLSSSDVDTDASGDITVTIGDAKRIYAAIMQIEGGYVANLTGVSGNQATFRVFKEKNDGGGATALVAHTSANNIADATVIAFGE